MNLMYAFFREARENKLIPDNPVARSVKLPKPVEPRQRVLTVEEQEQFLQAAKKNPNYPQFLFMLQTGVRTGEMVGLKWEDIDFDNGIIRINRSMEFRNKETGWRIGPPKSKSGRRTIPMTTVCRNLLLQEKEKRLLGKAENGVKFSQNDIFYVRFYSITIKNVDLIHIIPYNSNIITCQMA